MPPTSLEARVQNRTRELDHANAKLQHENLHDALTGLPNRTCLQQRLGVAWSRFGSEGGHLAVMFIDLDRFKMVNDSLGHHFGDLLLMQAAQRLRGCLRKLTCWRAWAATSFRCWHRTRRWKW